MKVSTLIKNVFSDVEPVAKVIKSGELQRQVKTNAVYVDPDVIAKLFKFFVGRKDVEGTSLLRGKIYGTYLLINDAYCCEDSDGTAGSAVVDMDCFSQAANIDDGDYVVGLAHSHVGGIPVFMSEPDRRTQQGFQALFSDAVALVMNPFGQDGICFRFYRFENGELKQIPHGFLLR